VGHLPSVVVEYCVTDGPRVYGRWEISCQEEGDVIVVDQHPSSVASRYVGHQPQRAYTSEEPIYAATGYASEEVCDILEVLRALLPQRRDREHDQPQWQVSRSMLYGNAVLFPGSVATWV